MEKYEEISKALLKGLEGLLEITESLMREIYLTGPVDPAYLEALNDAKRIIDLGSIALGNNSTEIEKLCLKFIRGGK